MEKSHAYLVAAHELTELLHAWASRHVQGHDDGDRYSCAAPRWVDTILENDGEPLLLRGDQAPTSVTMSSGLRLGSVVYCSCPPNRGDNYLGACPVHDHQSTYT